MSDSENFIQEVTEELRRDKLFAMMRKYSWVGLTVIVVAVGSTAANEWVKFQKEKNAQSFGDALEAAIARRSAIEQSVALETIDANETQTPLLLLLKASVLKEIDKEGALRFLSDLSSDMEQPVIYRDAAILRQVIYAGDEMPAETRRSLLEGISEPGRPFRMLAREQLAYLFLEENKEEEALSLLAAIVLDQESPEGLRRRSSDMIKALGGMEFLPKGTN